MTAFPYPGSQSSDSNHHLLEHKTARNSCHKTTTIWARSAYPYITSRVGEYAIDGRISKANRQIQDH